MEPWIFKCGFIDDCKINRTYTVTMTVTNDQPPVPVCATGRTFECGTTQQASAAATDTWADGPDPDHPFVVLGTSCSGSMPVTVTASDNCGLTKTCTETISRCAERLGGRPAATTAQDHLAMRLGRHCYYCHDHGGAYRRYLPSN